MDRMFNDTYLINCFFNAADSNVMVFPFKKICPIGHLPRPNGSRETFCNHLPGGRCEVHVCFVGDIVARVT